MVMLVLGMVVIIYFETIRRAIATMPPLVVYLIIVTVVSVSLLICLTYANDLFGG